jgi:C4-dicarboxylate-specific signal transduction histidine kinase
VIGLVEVVDTEVEQTFAAEDIAFTQFLANQAAAAMENARLYAQAQQEILERQQKEKELRQMANRNQAILDAIPDSLFFLSRQGQLLDYRIVNGDNLLLEIFDQGMPPTQQNLNYPPQLLSHMMEQFVTAIGKALDQRTTQVLEYQSPSLFDIQYYETRLVASGKDEALAIVRNVTQRKQTERQLIHTERLAALGQLAAALAHEINNPLQAIQSNLDLILQYPLTASENEQYLQVIHRQVERMTNITHKVLNFTRPQTSPRELVLITDLIEDVLTLTGKKLEQCSINVIVEAPDDLPFVLAVPQQLTQVFLNLVINTLEAVTGQNGQLNISIYQEIDEIVVSFTSNSPIIPPEILSRIFDPFFTTKPDGNGLGLWVSHSLIQRHNGSLTVENLTNKRGVVFTVRLPILDPLE